MITYYIKTDENQMVIAQSANICLSPVEIEGGGWLSIPAAIEGEIVRDGVPLYKLKSGKVTARTKAELDADTLEAIIKPLIAAKIAQTKAVLAEFLAHNPLESSAHGGKTARYSVTSEKQALLTSEMLMAQGVAATGIAYEPKWNAAGQPSEPWTLPELQQLALEIAAYVKPLVAYQQGLEVELNKMAAHTGTSAEDVAAFVIDYNGITL